MGSEDITYTDPHHDWAKITVRVFAYRLIFADTGDETTTAGMPADVADRVEAAQARLAR